MRLKFTRIRSSSAFCIIHKIISDNNKIHKDVHLGKDNIINPFSHKNK